MAALNLTAAWNETAIFVKREARLIFPIALLLNALPIAFATAMAPRPASGALMPEAGAWMLLIPVAAAIGLVGRIAISTLALRPGRSVGEALRRGAARFLPLAAVYLLAGLAIALALLFVAMILGLLVPGAASGAPSAQAARSFALLLALVMVPLLLFAFTRILLAAPIAAAEECGPVDLAKRSWRLSGPVFWPLVGFIVLSSVLSLVISFVGVRIVGLPILLVAGPPQPGSISAVLLLVVAAFVDMVVQACLITMTARLYAQLAPPDRAAVFS